MTLITVKVFCAFRRRMVDFWCVYTGRAMHPVFQQLKTSPEQIQIHGVIRHKKVGWHFFRRRTSGIVPVRGLLELAFLLQ